jgi:hypothetical protein
MIAFWDVAPCSLAEVYRSIPEVRTASTEWFSYDSMKNSRLCKQQLSVELYNGDALHTFSDKIWVLKGRTAIEGVWEIGMLLAAWDNVWKHKMTGGQGKLHYKEFHNLYSSSNITERRGLVVKHSCFIFSGPGFKSRPGDWLRSFVAYSVPPGEYRDSALIRPRPLPSKPFPIHYSLITLSFNVVYSELLKKRR